MSKKKTIEEILKEFKSIHGDKYDYSLIIEYKDRKTKLPIICHCKDDDGNEHGIFYQSACSHFFKKQGCPKCAKNGVKYTNGEFIKKVQKEHPELDFSKTNYVNAHTKIIVTCKKHGDFEIRPYLLLQNHGCPKCAFEKRSESRLIGLEEFIKRSNKIHFNKYDYSKVEYSGMKNQICIICPIHGEFYQNAGAHLYQECGCPKCRMSKMEREIISSFPNFEHEKSFNWLKYQYPLRLDFFIPNMNIAIECQGEQHFTQIWWRNIKTEYHTFKNTFDRDVIKYDLCKKHNIEIIYYFPKRFLKYNLDFYKDKKCFHTINDLKKFIDNGYK